MNRDKVLEIAAEVYGKDVTWRGVPLKRLLLFAEKISEYARSVDTQTETSAKSSPLTQPRKVEQ